MAPTRGKGFDMALDDEAPGSHDGWLLFIRISTILGAVLAGWVMWTWQTKKCKKQGKDSKCTVQKVLWSLGAVGAVILIGTLLRTFVGILRSQGHEWIKNTLNDPSAREL